MKNIKERPPIRNTPVYKRSIVNTRSSKYFEESDESEDSFEERYTTNFEKCFDSNSFVAESYNNKDDYEYIYNKSSESVSKTWLLLALVALPLFVLTLLFYGNNKNIAATCDLKNVHKNHKEYSDLIFSASTVFEIMHNDHSSTTGVFLLLHRPKSKIKTFLDELTRELAACYGNKPARLTIEDFRKCPEVIGCVINRYKVVTKQSDVVIIDNLNELPIETAHELHAICDTHDPIHIPSMIFLTLTISNELDNKSSAKQTANKVLQHLWKELEPNDRDMLIARITDQVFWISK